MSQQRAIKRGIDARYRKEAKKRTTCKRCGALLIAKPGYGYVCVCAKCDFMSRQDEPEATERGQDEGEL